MKTSLSLSKYLVILGLALGSSVCGSIISIPGDFSTIQQGIDAAQVGDTVKVSGGTFTENLSVYKGLALIGSGSDETVLTPAVPDTYTLLLSNVSDSFIFKGFYRYRWR